MPALTGLPALDVAIGLFFVFFLLSVVCSAVNEAIATVLAWRSQTLLAGLRSMLADSTDPPVRLRQEPGQATAPRAELPSPGTSGPATDAAETRLIPTVSPADATAATRAAAAASGPLLTRLLEHPLIRSQVDETARREIRRTVPSYLETRTFALALLDTLSVDGDERDSAVQRVEKGIRALENPHVKGALNAVLRDAGGDITRLRAGVEDWFDATMARASGWYKRRTQLSLWVIAAAVTLVLNADTGQIASALWKDPVLRASVAAQAQSAVSGGDTSDLTGDDDTLASKVDDVEQLSLPIGWSTDPDDPRWPDDAAGVLAKLIGWLATIAALSLGAPFWFDLLGKVSRIRGGGTQPRSGT